MCVVCMCVRALASVCSSPSRPHTHYRIIVRSHLRASALKDRMLASVAKANEKEADDRAAKAEAELATHRVAHAKLPTRREFMDAKADAAQATTRVEVLEAALDEARSVRAGVG